MQDNMKWKIYNKRKKRQKNKKKKTTKNKRSLNWFSAYSVLSFSFSFITSKFLLELCENRQINRDRNTFDPGFFLHLNINFHWTYSFNRNTCRTRCCRHWAIYIGKYAKRKIPEMNSNRNKVKKRSTLVHHTKWFNFTFLWSSNKAKEIKGTPVFDSTSSHIPRCTHFQRIIPRISFDTNHKK